MQNYIKNWLGITGLEQQVDYVSKESAVSFNRATYALTLALEQIEKDAIKPSKKTVKKITKTNKK